MSDRRIFDLRIFCEDGASKRRYPTIVADPPWPLEWTGPRMRKGGSWGEKRYRPTKHVLGYSTMSVDAIAALPISEIADEDAHLYLWTFDKFVLNGAATQVAYGWGFTPQRFLVWKKPGFGMGHFPRPQHELVLIAKRGKLSFGGPRNIGSVQEWPFVYERRGGSVARKHSAKPPAFLDLVESVSPGPYLELFARSNRLGWDTWGNEALEHVEIAS